MADMHQDAHGDSGSPSGFSRIGLQEFAFEINGAIKILESERESGAVHRGKVVNECLWLEVPEETVIVGDIHGDLGSLCKILKEINFEQFLANRNNKIIFLGDYIDRGSDSISVLHTICHLKNTYPDAVVLMRGNHEAPDEFPFNAHDFPEKIVEYFPHDGSKVHKMSLSLFRLMATMVIIDGQILLVHGGLPVECDSYNGKTFQKYSKSMLEEILWNDPRTIQNVAWERSRRQYGRHFGKPVTEKWLKATGTRMVVRGHEPCMGFKIDHDGMILTLFSCKESYPKFEAGYLRVKKSMIESTGDAADLSSHVKFVR